MFFIYLGVVVFFHFSIYAGVLLEIPTILLISFLTLLFNIAFEFIREQLFKNFNSSDLVGWIEKWSAKSEFVFLF